MLFTYETVTLYGCSFLNIRLNTDFVTLLVALWYDLQVPQPYRCNGHNLGTPIVWADPRSLAATEGVDFSLLSCGY
jgi:hypothetical protein